MTAKPSPKRWLKESLKISGKVYHLYDFADTLHGAERLKREAISEGSASARVVLRKKAYMESYPSGKPLIQKVYAVYARG